MRPIDADVLVTSLCMDGSLSYRTFKAVNRIIDAMQTIDPVKHGKWEDENPIEPNPMFRAAVCSACGCTEGNPNNYCPSCGARMGGEE